MLVEMALLVLIGGAIFLYVLIPLIRPQGGNEDPEETSESSPAEAQPVSDTL